MTPEIIASPCRGCAREFQDGDKPCPGCKLIEEFDKTAFPKQEGDRLESETHQDAWELHYTKSVDPNRVCAVCQGAIHKKNKSGICTFCLKYRRDEVEAYRRAMSEIDGTQKCTSCKRWLPKELFIGVYGKPVAGCKKCRENASVLSRIKYQRRREDEQAHND